MDIQMATQFNPDPKQHSGATSNKEWISYCKEGQMEFKFIIADAPLEPVLVAPK